MAPRGFFVSVVRYSESACKSGMNWTGIRRIVRRGVFVGTLLYLFGNANQVLAIEDEFRTPAMIVTLGDIDGAFDDVVQLLREVDLLDQSNHWTGGDTHLVSLGNLIAGESPTGEVIDLFMSLQQQAQVAGGSVHVLLGSQELDWLKTSGDSMDSKTSVWLRQRPLIIKINDKVFAHGGIANEFTGEIISSLNKKARLLLASDDLSQTSVSRKGDRPSVFSARGPLAYKGTAMCHPFSESFNTERFLKKVGATRYITAHVPIHDRVVSRMDGMVILLGTGGGDSGSLSALLDNGDEMIVHLLGEEKRLPVQQERHQLSYRLSGMSDVELENFLKESEIVEVNEIGTGITNPWRVEQINDGVRQGAVFKYVDSNRGIESRKFYNTRQSDESDRYVYELATYKLDRMMDMQLVPVTVESTVRGKKGVLQYWISNAINERDRLEKDIAFASPCDKQEQYRLRIVFDILIHNDDRNLTNIVWTKKDFMMMFIDHTRAFRASGKSPKQYRKVTVRVSDLLRRKLEELNEQNLTEELGAYLHPKQITAILARRDLVLNRMVSTD